MFDSQVIAFTFVAAVLAVTPGADTLLVMKNGIRSGSGAGWATTFGILGGTVIHAVISALGISVVVAQSQALFQVINKYKVAQVVCGAGLLVALIFALEFGAWKKLAGAAVGGMLAAWLQRSKAHEGKQIA